MKPLFFLLATAAFGTASCHKSNSSPTITGSWQWVESDWIIGLDTGKAYPGPDTVVGLQFKPGQRYTVCLNGQVQIDNSFSLQTGTDSVLSFNGQLLSSSAAEFGLDGRYIYFTNNDSLTLISDGPYNPAGAFTTMKFISHQSPFIGVH